MEHQWFYLAKIRCLLIEANLHLIEVWSVAKIKIQIVVKMLKIQKNCLAEESANISRNLFRWGKMGHF